MKVIDLLNKIAKGEEVPKKIKIYRITFELEYDEETESNYYMSSIDGELLNVICASVKELNEEIEIIEEDKPTKSIDSEYFYTNDTRYNELIDEIALNRELIIELKKEGKQE